MPFGNSWTRHHIEATCVSKCIYRPSHWSLGIWSEEKDFIKMGRKSWADLKVKKGPGKKTKKQPPPEENLPKELRKLDCVLRKSKSAWLIKEGLGLTKLMKNGESPVIFKESKFHLSLLMGSVNDQYIIYAEFKSDRASGIAWSGSSRQFSCPHQDHIPNCQKFYSEI